MEVIDLTSDVEIIQDSESEDDASLILIEDDGEIDLTVSPTSDTDLNFGESLGTLRQSFRKASDKKEASEKEGATSHFSSSSRQITRISYEVYEEDLERTVDPFHAIKDLKRALIRLPDRPHHWRSFENRTLTESEQNEIDSLRTEITSKLLDSQPGRDLMSFLIHQDQKMLNFIDDPFESDFIQMDRMPHPLRCILRKQAGYYGLRFEPRGEGAKKYWVLVRMTETRFRNGDYVRFFVDQLDLLFWNEWEAYQRKREEDVVGSFGSFKCYFQDIRVLINSR